MRKYLELFVRDESGAVALEYALITLLIAMGIVAGAKLLGTDLSTLFTNLGGAVAAVTIPTL